MRAFKLAVQNAVTLLSFALVTFCARAAEVTPPTTLTATATGQTVRLTWKGDGQLGVLYRVERRPQGGEYAVIYTGSVALPATYSDANVAPGTFQYRVFATVTGTQTGLFSNEVEVVVPQSTLLAPGPLTAQVNPTAVALTWVDSTADETGFEVQRKQGEHFYTISRSSTPNLTNYLDSMLPSGTYIYRVRALRNEVAGLWSNETRAIVPVPAPGPLTGQIAFQSTRNGVPDIFLINGDGTDERQLTRNNGLNTQPAFSWDGTKIVFSSTRDGDSEIFSMNADGSNQKQLTFNTISDSIPSWSPDGQKIIFTSYRSGNGDIYTMNADGSDQRQLTQSDAIETSAVYSPNGNLIAFLSSEAGGTAMWLMDADGTNRHLISPSMGGRPAFTRDGLCVMGQAPVNGFTNIAIVRLDGTGFSWLTDSPYLSFNPTASPDGRRIAFSALRNSTALMDTEIYVANTDGTNVQRLTNNKFSDANASWGPIPPTMLRARNRDSR